MAKKPTTVNFHLTRAIHMNGEVIKPNLAKGKKTIISIAQTLAKELEAASKGVITTAKANTEIKAVESPDDADLDKAFGAEQE
tara:strand:- start:120 stop:368 length:249 start_codon:yes stop_codon:yes gene_type:complete